MYDRNVRKAARMTGLGQNKLETAENWISRVINKARTGTLSNFSGAKCVTIFLLYTNPKVKLNILCETLRSLSPPPSNSKFGTPLI